MFMKIRVFLFAVVAMLMLAAVYVSPVRADNAASSDLSDTYQSYYCPAVRSTCFTWSRSHNARRIVIRGTNPFGRIVLVNRRGTWVIQSSSRNTPWVELGKWTAEALNSGNARTYPHFTLFGRQTIEKDFRAWLYFTNLHSRGRFYASFDVDEDTNGNASFVSEGSFPNGGMTISQLFTGNGCSTYVPVSVYTWPDDGGNGDEYELLSSYTSNLLNADPSGMNDAQIVHQIETLIDQPEYVQFVVEMRTQYPPVMSCGDEEPPYIP